MQSYNHKRIEKKWQRVWEMKGENRAAAKQGAKKFYALIEFPYASGEGLHVGHIRSNTAMDIIARKRRAEGFNVLYPIGWDAFGLPTENYAIKTGTDPAVIIKRNTTNFRKQLKAFGFSFDWSREINTSDPNYYKWTQWIFLKMFERGLAYKKKMAINWCPSCKIGLANEEAVDGKCERCGGMIEKRDKEQWMLAITKYADRLDKDLDEVDYLPQIKTQQRNWIGRSEGYEIIFSIKQNKEKITVFTTRPETILGVSFIALSPSHPLAKNAKNLRVVNPTNGEEVPVFVADYVMDDYGTGAVMGVPAHDERDAEFAKANNLPVKNAPFADNALIEKIGKKVVKHKLRDWIFSRQRYWGEPIPLIFCGPPAGGCGWVPVPEKNLPVKLPKVKNYKPTDTGESPLAAIAKWVNTKCPKCKEPAKRETDTMPNWAGSSWYYLRYTDPKNKRAFASMRTLRYWTPVDWYNGGMEHTTLHLLYSRFWHKFLFDLGLVPTSEPFLKRTSHGLVLAEGEGGAKMSKSKGNVVNPDALVKEYGADALRIYEMFMGPFSQSVVWSSKALVGPRRFLERVWRLREKIKHGAKQIFKMSGASEASGPRTFENLVSRSVLLHQTIKKVSEDIESMRFNTAVSALMILVNEMEKAPSVLQAHYDTLLRLLAPFAPHLSEELWYGLGHKTSIHREPWPAFDAQKVVGEKAIIVAQVNGKTRGSFEAERGASDVALKYSAAALPAIAKRLAGKEIKKVIVVKNRLVNMVVA